jgi:hypothetical protein
VEDGKAAALLFTRTKYTINPRDLELNKAQLNATMMGKSIQVARHDAVRGQLVEAIVMASHYRVRYS